MSPLSEWQTFWAVQAAAAVTLTGLVFVAVSINLRQIVETPGLPGRAAESIVHFLQVFFVCTVLLIPKQALSAVGWEVLAVTLLSWTIQVLAQIRYAKTRAGHPVWWLVLRIVQTHLASVPMAVGAVMLGLGWEAGLGWMVPGFIFSFVSGVLNAWVLLVEILR